MSERSMGCEEWKHKMRSVPYFNSGNTDKRIFFQTMSTQQIHTARFLKRKSDFFKNRISLILMVPRLGQAYVLLQCALLRLS